MRSPCLFVRYILTTRQALLIAQARSNRYADLLRSVLHICFFATPHQGTRSIPEFVLNLGHVLTGSKSSSLFEELKLWNTYLIELNHMWVEIVDGFTITSFFERRPYKGIEVR
jgi:hypothetical protein